MKTISYGYKRQIALPYPQAVERIKEELKKEGFGIMSQIDVKETLKTKLNVDFDEYIILGACNPPFAYQALQAERDIGLLMPCNVIVYRTDNQTYITATMPTVTMNMVKNASLAVIAGQVEQKLKKAVDSV